MKPTSSGNLGTTGIPGAETRGSTPPTPGMMTHNSLKKFFNYYFFISLSFGCHIYILLLCSILPYLFVPIKKLPPLLLETDYLCKTCVICCICCCSYITIISSSIAAPTQNLFRYLNLIFIIN